MKLSPMTILSLCLIAASAQAEEQTEITAGDAVRTPPGVNHWHGASATGSVSRIVNINMRDGKNVVWMEKVSDEQYGR